MVGVATGLALSGRIVFVYSIANFPTLRCLEQLRNDVCYHRANVKIVALGGGYAYGALGMTHHATEDLAVMRALPEMTVVAPGDPVEAALATRAIAAVPGPCYLRLGRAGEPVVHRGEVSFQLGKTIQLRDGNDVTLISTGGVLPLAVRAAEMLAERGVEARLLSMPTLKPLDAGAVLAAARQTRGLVTIEEHTVAGGLGGAVAEVLAESGQRVPFVRLGLPPAFAACSGSQDYLRAQQGITAEGVVAAAESLRIAPGRPGTDGISAGTQPAQTRSQGGAP